MPNLPSVAHPLAGSLMGLPDFVTVTTNLSATGWTFGALPASFTSLTSTYTGGWTVPNVYVGS